MENPPAGRANHDPRATSRCIIAVFLQRAGGLSSLLAARVARFSPAAFVLLHAKKVNNALHDSASASGVECPAQPSHMVRWASPDGLLR
jgi:hypothetical protein